MTKVVFITGSTRGIGKSVAYAFATSGYTVILNGRKETDNSKKLIADIKKLSPESDIYYFDIADQTQVTRACQKIIKRYQKVDILVNNAGIVKNQLFSAMIYDDWDSVLKINLYGTFWVTRQLFPFMMNDNWGRIINLSSISGLTGDFGQTNYSASKAGIIGFTKSLAKEAAKYNITVNAVCPGLVNTEILQNVPQEYIDKMLNDIPLHRMATPEEIAKLILFLASDDSAYITGEHININGGWL